MYLALHFFGFGQMVLLSARENRQVSDVLSSMSRHQDFPGVDAYEPIFSLGIKMRIVYLQVLQPTEDGSVFHPSNEERGSNLRERSRSRIPLQFKQKAIVCVRYCFPRMLIFIFMEESRIY